MVRRADEGPMVEFSKLSAYVDRVWDQDILPALDAYIRIPNKSPAFDAGWQAHGYMDQAVTLLESWARDKLKAAPDATLEVVRLDGRTPVIFIDIPGSGPEANDDTILLYGHLDKQPEMEGWSEGLGPWTPVMKDGKLYGRGGADDGYALFASLTAILALAEQQAAHARCVVLIEACEESGSYDLPAYVEHLKARIGSPTLVICLDSGCGNYDQLWLTTSLRGLAAGLLTVEVLEHGIHSGMGSGIVASSFRIARHLLSRIEDPVTGKITDAAFGVEIPKARITQAKAAADILGDTVFTEMPFVPGMRPVSPDPVELLLNRTWRAALTTVGAAGLPPPAQAGNVLRPRTALKLSLRLPPTLDADKATDHLKAMLEADPPYGAHVTFETDHAGSGWNSPALAPWLEDALETASKAAFGQPAAMIGEGGTIPFMGMLGEAYPQAQFVITGVLGPASNAHGPDEFLHVPFAKKLTAAIALLIEAHHGRAR
jgi:acetylornithine deacetylase/succinyl-diaminopimelate desuccinylase-like protein